MLVSNVYTQIQKFCMKSNTVLEQDKYWWTEGETGPQNISAFSTSPWVCFPYTFVTQGFTRTILSSWYLKKLCPIILCFLNSFPGAVWQRQLFNTTWSLFFWTTFLLFTPTYALLKMQLKEKGDRSNSALIFLIFIYISKSDEKQENY